MPGVWERLERDFVERLYYQSLKRFFLISHCCFKDQSPELCLMGSCCYILGNLREFMAVSQLFCTIIPFSWALYPPSHCKLFHHHPFSLLCVLLSGFVACFSPEPPAARWFYWLLSLYCSNFFIFYFFIFMGQFLSASSYPVNLSVSFHFFVSILFSLLLSACKPFHLSFMFFLFVSVNAAGWFSTYQCFCSFFFLFPSPPSAVLSNVKLAVLLMVGQEITEDWNYQVVNGINIWRW